MSFHEKILSHSFTLCNCTQAEVVATHNRSGRTDGPVQRIGVQQRGLAHLRLAGWEGNMSREITVGVEDLKRVDRSPGGDQRTVSLWDFQSSCIAKYCVTGNDSATGRNLIQSNCPVPSDS